MIKRMAKLYIRYLNLLWFHFNSITSFGHVNFFLTSWFSLKKKKKKKLCPDVS